jgi:membrane fusion protein (multidrug efflux system)
MEGSFVRKGQLLFTIDPRPFQAAVEQARAQLARATGQLAQSEAQLKQAVAEAMAAEAGQRRTQLDADRYVPLAKQKAVTQQDADNAVNNNVIAQARAEAARAAVETAKAQTVAAKAAEAAARAELESTEMNLAQLPQLCGRADYFRRFSRVVDGQNGIAVFCFQQRLATVAPADGRKSM